MGSHDICFLLLHDKVEAKLECYSNGDCAHNEVCNQGSCVDACLVTKCGPNARCQTLLHAAKCICLLGYTGNPDISCSPSESYQDPQSYTEYSFLLLLHVTLSFFSSLADLPVSPVVSVGCEVDDDCPDYTACRNRQCINPCARDDPCAKSAICRVVNHNAVCTCPNGFIGSPHTKCTPRKLTFYKMV